jgi:hypothetical protein
MLRRKGKSILRFFAPVMRTGDYKYFALACRGFAEDRVIFFSKASFWEN